MMLCQEKDFLKQNGGDPLVPVWLRDSRERAGLSQLALSKLAKVPQSNISLIEEGKQRITPRTWSRLTEAINRQRRKNREAEAKKLDRSVALSALFSGENLLLLRNRRAASKAAAEGVDLEKVLEQYELQKSVIDDLTRNLIETVPGAAGL